MFSSGFTPRSSTAAIIAVALMVCSAAPAASINYGSFGPVAPGITFVSVTEEATTDPVPLFGPPQVFSPGLDFNPSSFASIASGGAADATDGKLTFSVTKTNPAVRIDGLSLLESGDYSLIGAGAAPTNVSAETIIRATITHVSGTPIVPIVLTPVITSVSYSLPGDAGVVKPWSLGSAMDIQLQLVGLDVGPLDITGINFEIENNLQANSQASSSAFIAKKDFRLDLSLGVFIPEPGSLLLAGVACGTLLLRRR